MSTKTLNCLAPINPLGYGVVGLNLTCALDNLGVDVKLWPIGQIEAPEEAKAYLRKMIEGNHGYNKLAPSLRIWHQFDLAHHVGRGAHVGYPIFELNGFNEVERLEMSRMDYLFVCSNWAKQVIDSHNMNVPVHVVPCGVDRTIFNEKVGEPDPKWTTFLNVGKWEYRKGHDVLIEAFNRAFEPNDRVRLWMMNHNPFLTEYQTKEWEQMYKMGKMGHRVNFLPRVRTHREVADVMAQANCGVFPSRAEGWNLELLEMMSMGKQVIATDYSAHMQFCSSGNCMLLQVDNLEEAYDGVFFGEDSVGYWAELGESQIDAMVEYMRDVHKNKKLNQAGIHTAESYSWQAAARRVLEIEQIWG